MAGGIYIPWVKGLTSRREVLIMAGMLSVSPREVAAGCCEVWEWCDEEGTFDADRNCRVTGVTLRALRCLSDLHGLIDAMLRVGWIVPSCATPHIDLEQVTEWIFPKLGSWVVSSGKERLSNAERQRRHREKKRQQSNAGVTKVTLRNVTSNATENGHGSGVEWSIEEKRREETPPPPPPPPCSARASSAISDTHPGGGGGDGIWEQAKAIAREAILRPAIERLSAKLPRDGKYRRLIIAAAYLSLDPRLGRQWLDDAVEDTIRRRPTETVWGYFRQCLASGAEARDLDLDKLLAKVRVPERFLKASPPARPEAAP